MAVLRQPDEVISLVFDVTAPGLKMTTVALGSGPTNTIWQVDEVLSLSYNGANKLQVGTVAAGTYSAQLYQPNEVLRNVFDPSVSAIRVCKVSTGGGPVAGVRYQTDEILSHIYDTTAKALRVVSVSAGSGPANVYRQIDEVLGLVFDPVAHAIQEVGV
jgi:hypothetical protein